MIISYLNQPQFDHDGPDGVSQLIMAVDEEEHPVGILLFLLSWALDREDRSISYPLETTQYCVSLEDPCSLFQA